MLKNTQLNRNDNLLVSVRFQNAGVVLAKSIRHLSYGENRHSIATPVSYTHLTLPTTPYV